jgi:3'-phosphoadenosine 5'-phosphosulfate sulfotransferase (PAPS reductase)/FAD synthetase
MNTAHSLLLGPAPASGRVLAWFSCGDASAVAAKLAVEKYGSRCEVLYCDTFAYEHPDNRRFFSDVENWIGRKISVLKSEEYRDIFDVFERTRWLVGVGGARCTTELKKNVRRAYQRADDSQVFGFTADEKHRAKQFQNNSPEVFAEFPLIEAKISKTDCHRIIREAGIEIPAMYRLGYKNNNCIGCVKGQSGYWNKIRRDFPEAFDRMAKIERSLNAAICKKEGSINGKRWRKRVFLDELPDDAGRYENEADIECGVICINETKQKRR